MTTITALPDEVLFHIFSFVGESAPSAACKTFRRINQDYIKRTFDKLAADEDLKQLCNLRAIVLSNNSSTAKAQTIFRNLLAIHKQIFPWDTSISSQISHANYQRIKKNLIDKAEYSFLPKTIPLFVSEIQTIDFSNQNVYFFFRSLEQFSALKVLNLSGNSLRTLPRQIGSLINLEELHLADNQFCDFPREIINLHSLEVITLNRGNENFKDPIFEFAQLSDPQKESVMQLLCNSLEGFGHTPPFAQGMIFNSSDYFSRCIDSTTTSTPKCRCNIS
ncbi:MAG: hypothetical protein KAR79_04750 [Simkaniaceae bacterium]|nr:hypothetical protein [Simkaniaceae bacterium]